MNTYDLEILGNKLSIIHIPPSIGKPHVIRCHKTFKGGESKEEHQRVFVRKNTGTYPATKDDFELMYYDRKNIIPDYELHTNFSEAHVSFLRTTAMWLRRNLTIENTGRRPVAIKAIKMVISFPREGGQFENILLQTDGELGKPIIRSGDILNQGVSLNSGYTFNVEDTQYRYIVTTALNYELKEMNDLLLQIELVNGKVISSKAERII